jgi:hypothetical protein
VALAPVAAVVVAADEAVVEAGDGARAVLAASVEAAGDEAVAEV